MKIYKEFICFFFIINLVSILSQNQSIQESKAIEAVYAITDLSTPHKYLSKLALDIKLNPPDLKKFPDFKPKWVNMEKSLNNLIKQFDGDWIAIDKAIKIIYSINFAISNLQEKILNPTLDVDVIMESLNFSSIFDRLKEVEILLQLSTNQEANNARSAFENSDLNPFSDFMEQDVSEALRDIDREIVSIKKRLVELENTLQTRKEDFEIKKEKMLIDAININGNITSLNLSISESSRIKERYIEEMNELQLRIKELEKKRREKDAPEGYKTKKDLLEEMKKEYKQKLKNLEEEKAKEIRNEQERHFILDKNYRNDKIILLDQIQEYKRESTSWWDVWGKVKATFDTKLDELNYKLDTISMNQRISLNQNIEAIEAIDYRYKSFK